MAASTSAAFPSSLSTPNKILLNVGGDKYEVYSWKILSHFPNSRLGKLCSWAKDETLILQLCDDYDLEKNEYFFTRNSKTFSSILSLHYTGRFHMPEDICVVAFTEDLKYWGIEESHLDSCCLHRYFELLEQVREDAKEADETVTCVDQDNFGSCIAFSKCRRCIWNVFERPSSSLIAKIVAVISMISILVSTVVCALNTMPDFLMFECVYENASLCENPELVKDLTGSNFTRPSSENWIPVENYYFAVAEEICIAWFTFEYVIRLLVSPDKCKFVKELFNVFDLLAILPYYITVLLIALNMGSMSTEVRRIIQLCRLMRTIRVFKLARHSTGLQSFLFTLGRSYKELGILFLLLIMGVLLFSSFAYYAEKDDNSAFASIPAAFWWAAYTMSAVGLGNMTPITTAGKLISFVCGVCGMLFVGLPIPIIVDNFAAYYNKYNLRLKIVKKYKSLEKGDLSERNLGYPLPKPDFQFIGCVGNHVYQQKPELSSRLSQSKSSTRPVLNVGGVRFEIPWILVDTIPNSRLSQLGHCEAHEDLLQICDEYLIDSNEYSFHRDPKPFRSILNFYYTGKLHFLEDICPIAFEEELRYWMIDESSLEGCCQIKFNRRKEQVAQELKDIEDLLEQHAYEEAFGRSRIEKLRKHVWNLLEHPSSSRVAKVVGSASILVTFLSALVLTLKTVPSFAESVIVDDDCSSNKQDPSFSCHDTDNNSLVYRESQKLVNLELFCISWFACEYILKLTVSPNRKMFLRGKLNCLDPLIVISYMLTLYLSQYQHLVEAMIILKYFCETFRILRLLRIFKLGKHSTALEALGFTLQSSFNHLGVLLLFLAIGVLVFSSLAYIAEREDNPQFESIPATFWWALVTMHAISVGDTQTVTTSGKIVSFICGLFGLLFLVLPIPIIASNFDEFYKKKMRRERAQMKCKQDEQKLKNLVHERECDKHEEDGL